MSDLPELWVNAAAMGAVGLAGAVVATIRPARLGVVLVALLAVAGAALRGMLDRGWAIDSLIHDAPWAAALGLAAWAAVGGAGWLRARSWPAVVVATALFGDALVAVGLAAGEPDPGRRARLVLAASGASMIGVTSGAAPLLLGWGGVEAVGLGIVLAIVGWARGAGGVERGAPDGRGAAIAAAVALAGGLLAWTLALSGSLELAAKGLEALPTYMPRQDELLVAGAGLAAGGLGDEGLVALYAREVLARALALRGDDAAALLRAGIAVGGGLPLLLATRSSLKVGLPLWLVQVGLVLAWASSR